MLSSPTAGGQPFTGEPVESNLLSSSLSIPHMPLEPFQEQASTSCSHYGQHPTRLQPMSPTSSGQVGSCTVSLIADFSFVRALHYRYTVSTFSMLCQDTTHPSAIMVGCFVQGVFHMDPIKQAKAICNHGMSATALQQQLAEMKGRTSGCESYIRCGMQSGAAPSLPEIEPAKHHAAVSRGTYECRALLWWCCHEWKAFCRWYATYTCLLCIRALV